MISTVMASMSQRGCRSMENRAASYYRGSFTIWSAACLVQKHVTLASCASKILKDRCVHTLSAARTPPEQGRDGSAVLDRPSQSFPSSNTEFQANKPISATG